MIPDIPKWIDTCYVQNTLQKTEHDESIKISNMTVKPATVKGDNYLSDIYRVGVEFSRILDGIEIQEKRSLIVKLLPVDSPQEETIKAFGVFDTEILMMSSTLPRMNQMLTEIGMSPLSPRCVFLQQEKPIHLLFEDLATRGFRMADRQAGLDLDHCLLAIRNLGRFHASSIALKEKDPKAVNQYTKGFFHKDQPSLMRGVFKGGVKSLAKETSKWDELSPRISEKLHKLSEVAYEKGCKLMEYQEDEFNVLCHGDFWINNMLFSYDELGKPKDNIFVDFQLCLYGSPAADIHYFWAISPTDDVRLNHRNTILREYHNSLTSTMAKFKCSTRAPSFDDLQDILKRTAYYEAAIAMVTMPMIRLDQSKVKDFNEILSDLEGVYDHPAYHESWYRQIMTRLLPLYDSMGLLDDCGIIAKEI